MATVCPTVALKWNTGLIDSQSQSDLFNNNLYIKITSVEIHTRKLTNMNRAMLQQIGLSILPKCLIFFPFGTGTNNGRTQLQV